MTGLQHALTTWLGITLMIAAAIVVLTVDIARELRSDSGPTPAWIHVLAFIVAPLLVIAVFVATVVRVAALT